MLSNKDQPNGKTLENGRREPPYRGLKRETLLLLLILRFYPPLPLPFSSLFCLSLLFGERWNGNEIWLRSIHIVIKLLLIE